MCALTARVTPPQATPRRRTRATGLPLLSRRPADRARQAAMTIPASAGPAPGREAEPLQVTR
jgi:hypothetical protein